jgi:hypothetical protein
MSSLILSVIIWYILTKHGNDRHILLQISNSKCNKNHSKRSRFVQRELPDTKKLVLGFRSVLQESLKTDFERKRNVEWCDTDELQSVAVLLSAVRK